MPFYSTAPLLNEYKLNFALKRILKTVTGGLFQFSPSETTAFYIVNANLLRFVFYFLPWLISIPLQFYLFNAGFPILVEYYALIYGGITTFLVLGVRDIISLILSIIESKKIKGTIYPSEQQQTDTRGLFSDEEFNPIESLKQLWDFVFPTTLKRKVSLVFFEYILFGVLVGSSSIYLLQKILAIRYGSETFGWIVYIFGWNTVSMALFSITSGNIPEPNTYCTDDNYFSRNFSRPVYIFIPLLVFALEFTNPYLMTFNNGLYIFFLFLPIIWSLGLLPELSIFLLTIAEMIHTYILSGPSFLTTKRGLFSFLISLFSATVVAVTGYLARDNLVGIVSAMILGSLVSSSIFLDLIISRFIPSEVENSPSIYSHIAHDKKSKIIWILFRCFLSTLIGAFSAIDALNSNAITPTISNEWVVISGYCLLVVVVCLKSARELQACFTFAFFRNPFFGNPSLNPLVRGFFGTLEGLHRVLYSVVPFISTMYLGANSKLFPPVHFMDYVLLFRAFRSCWQDAEQTGVEIIVLHVLNAGLETGNPYVSNETWRNLVFVQKLLVAHILVDTFVQIVNKSKMIIINFINFYGSKKQRRKNWVVYLICNIIFSPVTLILLLVSSLLNMPLVSIFGLPIFVPLFQRPAKQWQSSISNKPYHGSKDWSLYSQLIPAILTSLGKKLSKFTVVQGRYYLVRVDEERTVIIQFLESWFDSFNVLAIGLEISGTSCHDLEMTRVDEVFDFAFNGKDLIDGNVFHALKPVFQFEVEDKVEMHGVLDGVIDSEKVMASVYPALFKIITWALFNHKDKVQLKRWFDSITLQSDLIDKYWKKFPYSFSKFLVKQRKDKSKNGIKVSIEEHDILTTPTASEEDSEIFEENLTTLAVCIYCSIIGGSMSSGGESVLSEDVVWRSYQGKFPGIESRAWIEKIVGLKEFCQTVFRWTFKLVHESVLVEGINDFGDLTEKLEEYSLLWHFTVDLPNSSLEQEEEFHDVLNNKKELSIFMIGKKDNGTYYYRLLKNGSCDCRLGEINNEVVRSTWANLALELIYFTNDDEERYSIQAHEALLRNIITQAAAPPLGYPVYSAMGHFDV